MMPLASAQAHGGVGLSHMTAEASSIIPLAIHLLRRRMRPPFSQSRNIGPMRRLRRIQTCKRREPRAAQNEASSMNGTVGNPGSAIPIRPSINARQAAASHKPRIERERCGRMRGGRVALIGTG